MNRDDRTVWGAYESSKEKLKNEKNKLSEGYIDGGRDEEKRSTNDDIGVPLIIFRDRTFSVLETIVAFLKDSLHMRYCQIARRLCKDDRTIWTIYRRFKKKEEKSY